MIYDELPKIKRTCSDNVIENRKTFNEKFDNIFFTIIFYHFLSSC